MNRKSNLLGELIENKKTEVVVRKHTSVESLEMFSQFGRNFRN